MNQSTEAEHDVITVSDLQAIITRVCDCLNQSEAEKRANIMRNRKNSSEALTLRLSGT